MSREAVFGPPFLLQEVAIADIFDWSSTASNNTVLDGISVATGMSPGNVDNAFRSAMALIRNTFVAGWEGLFAGTTSGIPVSNGAGTITAVAAPTGTIVGTTDTQTLTNKTISGGSVTGITDLAVADGGTGASTAAAAFANLATTASSLASPGYHKFPSGLMIQWGSDSINANTTSKTVTYPTAFTTFSIPVVSGGLAIATADENYAAVTGATTSNFTVSNSYGTGHSFWWIAIGV